MAGTPVLVTSPTESWLITKSMMIRSSGVICGVTSNFNTAGLIDTLVAPLELSSWYGIYVPDSIDAVCTSAVMTRGRETISAQPSVSMADNTNSNRYSTV